MHAFFGNLSLLFLTVAYTGRYRHIRIRIVTTYERLEPNKQIVVKKI